MKRVIEYSSAVLLGFSMLLGLAVLLGPHLGWQIDKVLSGSMSPAIKTGGAVVTQHVDPRAIAVGDVMTYHSPLDGRLTSHRVVGITSEDGLLFQTRGDANEDPDPYSVSAANVVGKVRFSIPYIGYPAQFAKTVWGFIIMIAVPGLIIIAFEVRDVWRELDKEEKQKKARAAASAQVTGEG